MGTRNLTMVVKGGEYYCPECGRHVFMDLKTEAHTLQHVPEGWLKLGEAKVWRHSV